MVFLVVGGKLGIVFYFCGGIFFVYMFYEDVKLVFVCVGYGGRWKFLIVLNLVRYLNLVLRILV